MEDLKGVAKRVGDTSSSVSVPFRIAISTAESALATRTFEKDAVVIGRDPKSDVHLDNMLVSRRHAEVRRNDGVFAIVDLNTQNGTLLNGKRVSGMALLNDGDGIQIGKFRLRFEADTAGNPLARLPKTAIPVGDQGGAGGMTLTMSPETEKRIAEDVSGRVRGHVVFPRRNAPEMRIFIAETFQIGKAPECDLVIKGWFVPRKAAVILRGHDRYTLINVSGAVGAITINEKPVADTHQLGHDDKIEIYGESFRFALK
jgi:pSer/pThr/pTyr-binding forkhead associated (FHA) protein